MIRMAVEATRTVGIPLDVSAAPTQDHDSVNHRISKWMENRLETTTEEALDGELKPFANGAHIAVVTRWRGADVKDVRIILSPQNDA